MTSNLVRYSYRLRRWFGTRPSRPAGSDPYQPGSPDFAERNRKHAIGYSSGLLRIDLGEPGFATEDCLL